MLSTTIASALLFIPSLAAGAAPAGSEGLPFDVMRLDASVGEVELTPRRDAIAALAARDSAQLDGVLLPDGTLVGLQLERLHTSRLGFGFQVDGEPAPALLDGLDLSVWHGVIVGRDDSRVALSFSQAGSRGWIRRADELFHLTVSAHPEKGWAEPQGLLLSDARLVELGFEAEAYCALDELPENEVRPRIARGGGGNNKAGGAPTLYEAQIAVETDYQLHQVFGNDLAAQTAYVTTLMTWVSWRYEEQVATVLTYPYVQFYTTSNDPWIAQDNGGNCIDVLYEFQAAWQGNIPANAHIGHMLSGANLGCGVAWLPGLCNDPYNFSVSGNMNGGVSFPVQVSANNWDFMVVAHELGHNFGSPHTHDYCPPLDECAPSGYYGQCQTQQTCTNQGTLMSYCHLCTGGLANVTTYLHPANVADMRTLIENNCVPVLCVDPVEYCAAKVSSNLCVPDIGWQGHPTLSGLDDFVVTADQVHNNQNGLLFFGGGPNSTPFNGGTLCVAPPTLRLSPQASGGNGPPASDCSGSYAQAWSHADLAAPGLGAGASVYSQYWFRDSASVGGTGLTNALSFTICN